MPLGTAAMAWINRYLKEVRPGYAREGSEDFVFLSHRSGRPLTVKGLWWALGEAFRRRGLPAIKPYSLRVAAATGLLLGGIKLYPIARMLRHAKLQTTQGYLRVEMVELANVLRCKHPRLAVEARLRRTKPERRKTP